MGLRGPVAKSAELRVREGQRAHRPLPPAAGLHVPGMPERPKGLTAKERLIWDEYIGLLAPLGFLRPVDGLALRRLVRDVVTLDELQVGQRKLIGEMRKQAKAQGKSLPGGAAISLSMSHEGRRLSASINTLASRIKRDEMQFGLTPVSSQRLENLAISLEPTGPGRYSAVDEALNEGPIHSAVQ